MTELKEYFPDGTPIDSWFYQTEIPALKTMGTQYVITNYHVLDDGKVHTREIQNVIDLAAANGGGVVVVPAGTYLSGSLYFKQGVNLYIAEGATLKGSDDISDYDLIETRMEGETCPYFAALINADGLDGFTMCGPGTIDGNGLRSWKAFWLRREWNRNCTNKDEQRARLVYLSNCKNVLLAGLNLQNAHYWTTHLYHCNHVKYLNCRIFSPEIPVKAPSTDAIDIDVCADVLIKGCYMEVNDDAVCLKGGKGPWADTLPENGMNERILIEDCSFGYCHGCLTCGSESLHNRNILMRRIKTSRAANLLRLKMRTDTPQHYEYITVEQVEGSVMCFLSVKPWVQFHDLKGRDEMPLSQAHHITLRDCSCVCNTYLELFRRDEQYRMSDFTFENLKITAKEYRDSHELIPDVAIKNVEVTLAQ